MNFFIPPDTIALNLAVRIHDNLAAPRTCEKSKSGKGYLVTGGVSLSHGNIETRARARCRFYILPDWMDETPTVICNEPWRAPGGGEWHIDNKGYLCTELNLRWKDEINRTCQEKGLCPAADFATHWLLNSSATLLDRQLMLFRGTINAWQDSWDYWAHGTPEGEAEYRDQRKRARRILSRPAV